MRQDICITVALPLTQAQSETLRAAAPQAVFRFLAPENVREEDVRDAQVLIGKIPPSVCAAAPRVRWYQAAAAGPDAYLKPGIFAPEVTVTTAVGAYGPAVSEHLFAMTLAVLKHLPAYRDAQRTHIWKNLGTTGTMAGANVLVLGAGDIGGSYAVLCHALGARVVGIRRHTEAAPGGMWDAQAAPDALDRLLPEADVVALFLPGGSGTYHLLDARRIALMKKGAVLVNGGRGTAVDTDALTAALRTGSMGGAALDVTDPEPLPPGHPLWDMENVLITPHAAGGFSLPQTLDRIVEIAADNLRRYLAGEPLHNAVERGTLEKGEKE